MPLSLTFAGFVIGAEAAYGQLGYQLTSLFGSATARVLLDAMRTSQQEEGVLATVVSKSHIETIVGRLQSPVDLAPASPDVERVMWVPLAEFVRPDTYRAERWTVPWVERVLYFFELDDETVWGATAFILRDLFSRLGAPAS